MLQRPPQHALPSQVSSRRRPIERSVGSFPLQCEANCAVCRHFNGVNGPSSICWRCNAGWAAVNGRCVPCASPACSSCHAGPSVCEACRDYFGVKENGCTKCGAGCLRCDGATGLCTECMYSLGVDKATGRCTEVRGQPAWGAAAWRC